MFESTPSWFFGEAVEQAMNKSELVDSMLTHGVDYSEHATYLTPDGLAGYAISPDGELVSVFNVSGEKRGKELMTSALANGARHWDCFDGYLTGFYESFGAKIVKREPNWTAGGPDVVYFEVAS